MQNRQVIEENDHHQQIVEQKVHMQIIVSLYHLNNHLLTPMASLGIIQGLLIPMASLGTIQGLTLWQLVHFGRTIQVRFVAKKKKTKHTQNKYALLLLYKIKMKISVSMFRVFMLKNYYCTVSILTECKLMSM